MAGLPLSSVSTSANRVVIEGAVADTRTTRTICNAVEGLTRSGVHHDLVFDFSACTEATQAAMLPLLAIVNEHRVHRALEVTLLRPREDAVERAFADGNWAHFFDPEQYEGESSFGELLPAMQFENEQEALRVPERVVEVVMRNTAVAPRTLRNLEWSLYEILDNVINHSQCDDGGFVQATPLQEHVEFVIADAGIGIARSLGIADDSEALRAAVKQGVTRDETSNQGNGLYGSLQIAARSGGEFEIASYGATMRYPGITEDEEISVERAETPYPGTAVRARIGLAELGPLHETLRFGGFSHDPVYGYVERQFETDEGEYVFSVKEHAARDVRSRGGGRRVRQQLENLLRESETVTVDFDGVEVISSSFADEVFGRLFVTLGPRVFTKRLILTNLNEDIDGLIDLAIELRWQTENKN